MLASVSGRCRPDTAPTATSTMAALGMGELSDKMMFLYKLTKANLIDLAMVLGDKSGQDGKKNKDKIIEEIVGLLHKGQLRDGAR